MTNGLMLPLLGAGGGYLLGAIPFGLLLTKIAGLGDIRKVGSGNIGATNVLRTGRKDLAAATLLLDGGKGAMAVLIAHFLAPDAVLAAAFGAFLGHIFPIWLKFQGGKGVATYLGVALALCWPAGVFACASWLFSAWAFRMSSLAALIMVSLSPLFMLALADRPTAAVVLAMSLLVSLRHHANIKRLFLGTEPRIGAKKPE